MLEESRAEKQAELESIGGADPTVIAKYDKVQNEVRALSARSLARLPPALAPS